MFAEVNGTKLYYEEEGAGHALVFLHAGIADLRMWDEQAPFFAQRYRVIRYDRRGFGRSEPTPDEFSNLEDLAALLDLLGVERAHLVGCSMGGGLAMDLALTQPERAASVTMVCSGPAGLTIDVPDAPELDALFEEAQAAWKEKDIERVAELEIRVFFDGMGRGPADVDPVLRQKALEMNRIALEHEARMPARQKPPLEPPAGQRLHELKLPLLIVAGALDEPYTHAAADYMMTQVAGAQHVLIEETAHLPSLERAQAFNQALWDFLAGL